MRWREVLMLGVCGTLLANEVYSQEKSATKEPAEKKAVPSASSAFEEAYNAHDIAKLTSLFTPTAVIINEEGEKHEGEKGLKQLFEMTFKNSPDGKMRIDVETIRPISETMSIEDGWTTFFPEPGAPETKRRYSLVSTKKDGKWLISSVRDFAPEVVITPHQRLQEIAWLIGEWIDEHDESIVETSCRWSEDGNFILQDFTVRFTGANTIKGTQRIGWDPLRKSFRSWTFDSEGAYSEATWWRDGYSWLIKTEGVTSDGEPASASRTITPLGKDAFGMTITERVSAGERLPDMSLTVVRRPPPPTETTSSTPKKK
ncbi:SgcJ/EcaC family oxidoreductase [bacterium]|nr:SgcJ/EcaC family oxidoreductase [bacterium]